MKKLILAVLVSATFALNLQAQSTTAGDQSSVKQLNFGVGASGHGIPVYVGMDFGIHPDVTLGGELSYRSYSEDWKFGNNGYKYRHNVFGALFNANYHFNRLLDLNSSWDLYAGANAGFYFWSTKYDGSGTHPDYDGDGTSGLGIGIQIGGRYFFSDQWAVNLELGGGNTVSGAKLGVTYRF